MQKQGNVRFLKFHDGSIRAVAFSPKDRYLFCSGSYDGRVILYSAQKMNFLMCYPITTMSLTRNVNAVRFTSDGSRILATTTARRLAVIDIERGEQLISYDNCAFNGRDRTGLAADPICPNMAACCYVNGKGITLFDLRMPLPLHFIYDAHNSIIRDITFLDNSWPCVNGRQSAIITVSSDGMCKTLSLDGRSLHCFDAGHAANSITPTPELFGSTADDGFHSIVMVGGDGISAYVPGYGIQERLKDQLDFPIWKLRYTSNGSMLYTACERGIVRRYRRYPDHHEYLGEVYRHRSDIQDMDISAYDEYIVTASKDRSIGVMCLGSPNHGWTGYSELT